MGQRGNRARAFINFLGTILILAAIGCDLCGAHDVGYWLLLAGVLLVAFGRR